MEWNNQREETEDMMVSKAPRGWSKDFGLYAEYVRKLLENSEQRSETNRLMF